MSNRPTRSPELIPDYLLDTYWWAYLTPEAIRLFDRPWLINLILWGNYRRLTRELIKEVRPHLKSTVVQIGCVYGELTNQVSGALKQGSQYTVVDVAPIQLAHLQSKLAGRPELQYLQADATDLTLPSSQSDLTVLFFLVHELPSAEKTLALNEAWRITKPKGKLVVIDYHRPSPMNPIGWLMKYVLNKLEPFALEIWDTEMSRFLTSKQKPRRVEKKTFFGGLYQKVTFIKN